MTNLIIIVLGIIMIGAAVMAVLKKSLISAVIAAGAVSLLASVIYIVLAAPDVAMTEAAIGSGLTSIVFLYALNKIRKQDNDD
jgi:energy-converting hydrogenase B subunit D